MGAFESGQAFLAGVLAKLPAEQRAQAEAILTSAEARDAVTLVGDGALARSDYSRSMDDLRGKETALNEHYARLNAWYDVNKTALDEAKTLKERGGGNGHGGSDRPAAGDPNPSGGGGILSDARVRELADQAVNDAGRDYIVASAYISGKTAQHYAMFNEPLDAMALVQNPKVGKPIVGQPGRVFSLEDAYQEAYGERLAQRHKEAEDKRIDEEVQKRLTERLRANQSQPFPMRSESSPLDVLASKDGPATHTLDTAVAEYERLQAARGA